LFANLSQGVKNGKTKARKRKEKKDEILNRLSVSHLLPNEAMLA
jgi:hypothetical protein